LKLIDLQERLRERVRATAEERFGIALAQVSAEIPPRTELGDLAFPVAFELAKRIKAATGEKQPPRRIAEELQLALQSDADVARVEVAGAGYLNVFYDRAKLLTRVAAEDEAFAKNADSASVEKALDSNVGTRGSVAAAGAATKCVVEHTSINPNKAAHIGHVRNAVLGDTFVRVLRATGERVDVQNYIDNTGVQVADVVVGFMHLEQMTLADVRALDASLTPDRPFDYYCWDLYARVGLFYRDGDPEAKELPERKQLRADTLHAIEAGDNPTAELADYVATRIVNCHLDTMERLSIRYDLLPRESEILHFLWDYAFEQIKKTGAIRYETEGRSAGCWVMPMDTHASTDEHEADKILVRSNGTITYTGKDIAYQLWKLGQVHLDFFYRPFRVYEDGRTVWMTTAVAPADGADTNAPPHFGGAKRVYNVIDTRQSYPQEVVRRGVAAIVPEAGEDASVHVSYEMVALSPAACEELGIELSAEDKARPFVEMSGRRGLGVKADDLIDRLEAGALNEVASRHPDLSDVERRQTAHAIAIGALRYFLLKWTRNSMIVFDFKEALSFEGETGPYCQYAAVRANSIFRKLDETAVASAFELLSAATGDEDGVAEIRRVLDGADGDELWSLVMLAARLDEVNAQSATQVEPAHLAKYAFQLARAFNLFYHRHRIIAEEDPTRRAALITIANFVRRQLTDALSTLGISVPERM
jgi:arginyl-tRNA synthetase